MIYQVKIFAKMMKVLLELVRLVMGGSIRNVQIRFKAEFEKTIVCVLRMFWRSDADMLW